MVRDGIEVEGLTVACVLGVLPDERDRVQPVRVDLSLDVDIATAGRSADLRDTIDYDRVATEIAALLTFRRYHLLETAAEEIAAMLLGVHPTITGLHLRVAKPEALRGRAAAAAVRITRVRSDLQLRHQTSDFGAIDVLLETRRAGLYLLHVAAGLEMPARHPRVLRTLQWLVAGSLWQGDAQVPLAQPVEWSHGHRYDYRNPSARVATLFCCDCPPMTVSD